MFRKLSKLSLDWNDAIRAALCMLPMLIAYVAGYDSLLVPLGQGGFFYSTLPLPQNRLEKIFYIFLMLGVGLGFYLLGGTIALHPWLSLLVTFIVSVTIGLLSGGKLIAPIAFSLVSVFSAGLNISNPDKLHTNYLGFTAIFIFCGLLSLLPIWKGKDMSKITIFKPEENMVEGVMLGIGSVIALFVANILEFARLGWPVSAVGTIIRFNEVESRKRAKSRVIGTVGGSIVAIIFFLLFSNPIVFIILAYIFGILHSLMSRTLLGKTVFFYTVTILILYSINDISQGPIIAAQRIAYNLVGVLIAIFILYYPFPLLKKRLQKVVKEYNSSRNKN
jgi:fusaric acid resistance family protein